jgi:transcriptional regulator with XRE-family HTH domain
VQKYETGANRVPASRLIHIAGALDVPVVALLGNRATDDGKFDRAALECRRRLSCAVESISDARLLNLAVELIEGMAKL